MLIQNQSLITVNDKARSDEVWNDKVTNNYSSHCQHIQLVLKWSTDRQYTSLKGDYT